MSELENQSSENGTSPAGVVNNEVRFFDTSCLNNSNTMTPSSIMRPFVAGIHWLALAINVAWGSWEDLRNRLLEAQGIARREGSAVLHFGSYRAVMHPHSPRMGQTNNPFRMDFFVTVEGLTFLLRDRCRACGRAPNLVLQANGLACLGSSAQEILTFARQVITSANGQIISEKLSRVDLAIDLPDVPITEFMQAFREHRYVCRASDRRMFEGTGTTLYYGKKPLQLCIYDKFYELRQKRGVEANDEMHLMLTRRWGGEVQAAVRVEYRLLRKALLSRGIDTPADFLAKAPELMQYLTHSWFRMTTHAVDRSNTSRATTLPLWEQVASGFQAWAGDPHGASLAPVPKQRSGVSSLTGRLRSLLLMIVARTHLRPMGPDEFRSAVDNLLTDVMRTVDIEAELTKRIAKISRGVAAALPLPPASPSCASSPPAIAGSCS